MMIRPSPLRSVSTSSTLSCIMLGNDPQSASMTASSSTPPTSNTDADSVMADVETELVSKVQSNGRVTRAQSTIASYNENISSRSAKRAPRRKGSRAGRRTVSGKTLVDNDAIVHHQLIQGNIQILDLGWGFDAEDGRKHAPKSSEELYRRRSSRLDVLKRTSSVVEEAKSVLGKRGRGATEVGREKLHGLQRRSSLRPQEESQAGRKPLLEKKRRLPETTEINEACAMAKSRIKFPIRPWVKRWLSQGLYVGQDRDFDARLTETQNKLKRISNDQSSARQRSVLPLPMFAGQRTLEMGRNFRLPFDVFSPLPPGQPKPEEWRKTQKNVFIGDAATVWKKSKPLEYSTCICEPGTGCNDDCFNRFMLYECDDNNCSIGAEHCTNRSFESLRQRCKAGGKYNAGVEVIKTLDRGYGVRSNRTFEPNQIIVEYAGEIITQDECEDRMRSRYQDSECFYLMVFDQNTIIDATRGSIARFVNHSCEPNCRMVKWTVSAKPRMALFAGDKGIMTGEELTYDYNFDPFSSKNIQECRCGAQSCRGILGPKPKDQVPKVREPKDALKSLVAKSTKPKCQQIVEDSLESVDNERHRLTVRKSPETVFKAAKATISSRSTNVKNSSSSTAKKAKLVKNVPERSSRMMRRLSTVEKLGGIVKKRNTMACTRRRCSNGISMNETPKKDLSASGRNRMKAAAASVKRNVVRTTRGADRASSSEIERTIRVNGNEDV